MLSKDCMKRRIRAIKMLEIERYNDIVAETEELCALYINTVWGKPITQTNVAQDHV